MRRTVNRHQLPTKSQRTIVHEQSITVAILKVFTVGEIVGEPPHETVLYSVMRTGTPDRCAISTPSEFQCTYAGTIAGSVSNDRK